VKLSKHQIIALKKAAAHKGKTQHWPESRSTTIMKLNDLGLTKWLNTFGPTEPTYGLTEKGWDFINRHKELFDAV
jgi:hypothetical protein